MNNIQSCSADTGLIGLYQKRCDENIRDLFTHYFSSQRELIDTAKGSLLFCKGAFFLISSPMFDSIPFAVESASYYSVFSHRFSDVIPDDSLTILGELKKICICFRLLTTITHENNTGNRIPVTHKEYSPIFIWNEKQLQRYEITYDNATGRFEIVTPYGCTNPIDALRDRIISIQKKFIPELRYRCSASKYNEYVWQLMDAYFINGHTCYDEQFDELQIRFIAKEINRLKDTQEVKYGFGESYRLIEKYRARYEELVDKYKHADNYLGRWARDFINKQKH